MGVDDRSASLNRLTFAADYLRPLLADARLRFATATLAGDDERAQVAQREWRAFESALACVETPLLAADIQRMAASLRAKEAHA